MENNAEQLKGFIENLINTQNELIRKLGCNISSCDSEPFDYEFDTIIDSVRKAKKAVSQAMADEKRKLDEKIEILNREILDNETTIKDLNSKIQSLEDDNSELKTKYENVLNENEDIRKKFRSMTEDSEQKIAEAISNSNKEIVKIREELSEKASLADEFETFAKPYRELLDKIYMCESLSVYREQNKFINDNSVKSIMKIYRCTGNVNFAWNIIKKMKEYKENNIFPVSSEEIELMNTVNNFYKKKFPKITENIIYLPSGSDENHITNLNIKYNSAEMKIIGTQFAPKYVTDIITPCCKIDDTVEPAFVRGVSED